MRTDAAGSTTALLPHWCLFVSKEGTGPRTRTEAAHWSGGLVRTRILFSFFQNPSVQQIDSLRYFFSQRWVITTRATAIRLMHYSTSETNTDEHWLNLARQLGAENVHSETFLIVALMCLRESIQKLLPKMKLLNILKLQEIRMEKLKAMGVWLGPWWPW